MMVSLSAVCPDMGHLGEFHPSAMPGATTFTSGPYNLFDLYCADLSCDCYKVSLKILDCYHQSVATIAYGWKPAAYYHQWGLDKETTRNLTKGFLDPLEVQSEDAPHFLIFIMNVVNQDEEFLEVIQDRYKVFKETIQAQKS